MSEKTRIGSDLLGEKQIPAEALYDVQTLRCLENFNISHFHLNEYPNYLKGLAITKMGAAEANHSLGLITDEVYDAIMTACREICEGRHAEGHAHPRHLEAFRTAHLMAYLPLS